MNRRSQKGFVLLAVVVVLAIVGLILVRVATNSMQLTLHAQRRADQLQQVWARQSIERTVLPLAGNAFDSWNDPKVVSSVGGFTPVRSAAADLPIGDLTVRLVLQDEDAKLNANQLYLHVGLAQVDSMLKGFTPLVADVPIQLLPAVPNATMQRAWQEGKDVPRAFVSWGQILRFEGASVPGRIAALSAVSRSVTCFGQMKLNYLRSDQRALEEVLQLAIPRKDAVEMSDVIYANPRVDLRALLAGRGHDEKVVRKLNSLLTQVSSCFSLQTEIFAHQENPASTAPKLVSIAVLERPTSNNGEGDADPGPSQWHRFVLR